MSSSASAKTHPAEFPITVFYAFKQSEDDSDGGHASTGWETLARRHDHFWLGRDRYLADRTERGGRSRDIESNALASSIVLACRPRPADAGFTDRRGLINALREEFPDALRKLEQGKVAPVDLRQAAIGPGMAVFSRYARVNEPDGSPMRVRAALSLINQVLDEKLSQLEGNVSADTRFCVEWFKQYGFDQGPYGTAETLSKGIDTSITGLERAGVLVSRAGKVKLQSVRDIPDFYDPRDDERTSEWEICLHLAKQLDRSGVDAAASLMAAAREVPGIDLDDVRELAYLLYSIAEKKGWAETALLFNNLGTSWTDIEDASRRAAAGAGGLRAGRVRCWSTGAKRMATSNRERIDQGLQLLGQGLKPFVEAVMAPAAQGRDWVEVLDARNNARRGTHFSSSVDDPRFLLSVITDENRMFRDKLSRAEQSFASELRDTGNKLAHGAAFSADDTYRALDTMERLLTAADATDRGGRGAEAAAGRAAGGVQLRDSSCRAGRDRGRGARAEAVA